MSSLSRDRRLPDGFVARLRPDLIRNTGALLVGGSPLRAVRLSDRARHYVARDRVVVRDGLSAELAARLLDGNLADPEPMGLDVTAADVTVVVPVRDRVVQLDRCLAALNGLKCVVVDDASHDAAMVAAVAARHGARVVELAVNMGPAAARNAGLAIVRTPYIAFVDSDVEVSPATLLGLARHFSDTQVALIGPMVVGRSRSPQPRWFERYDEMASSLDLGTSPARVRPGARVAWLPSACLVGRVSQLRAVNGFDEAMRVGEDVDLVWRLMDREAAVRYDPAWVARHDTRGTMRGWLGRKYVYGTGSAGLMERHGSRTAPAVLHPYAAAGAAALLLRKKWALPLVAITLAASTRALRRQLPAAPKHGVPLEVALAVRGVGWALRQESDLLLRHWCPPTLIAVLMSSNARRMVASALIVDAFAAVLRPSDVGLLTRLAGRRLDDMSYGLGLWAGAVRHRSLRCILPRRSP